MAGMSDKHKTQGHSGGVPSARSVLDDGTHGDASIPVGWTSCSHMPMRTAAVNGGLPIQRESRVERAVDRRRLGSRAKASSELGFATPSCLREYDIRVARLGEQ